MTQHKTLPDETAHAIDEEVRRIIDTNFVRARQLLEDNMDKLHAMASALVKYETIDKEQIDDIMAGKEPREPADWSSDEPPSGSGVSTDEAAGKSKSDGKIGGPASLH